MSDQVGHGSGQPQASATLSLRELAERINAHLKRLERGGLRPDFKQAGAYYMGGARVRLTYVSREGGTTLSRDKASRYLAWLDAGHVGKHTDYVEPNRFASTQVLDGGGAPRKDRA